MHAWRVTYTDSAEALVGQRTLVLKECARLCALRAN